MNLKKCNLLITVMTLYDIGNLLLLEYFYI